MVNLTTVWWRSYRQNLYKPQHKDNVEMVVRRTMRECLTEYLRRCTISGVDHITDPEAPWWQKLFWLLMFASVTATLVFCLIFIWSSLSQPLIVSMESTTYPIGKIDFPAIAFCNVNRISKKVVHGLASELYELYGKEKNFKEQFGSLENFESVFTQFGRLINFEYNDGKRDGLTYGSSTDYYDTHSLVELMKALAPNCSEMLNICVWLGETVPCDEIMYTRRTARGHCCAFNYVLKNNGIQREMYTIGEVRRQSVPGARNGLFLVLDPQIEEYSYATHPIKGFDVILFDAKQFPDISGGRIIHSFVEVNTMNSLEIRSRVQLATAEVRKYSPSTRNCYFQDEVPDFGPIYSMSACISRCRIDTVQSLCKCTPYFLPISREEGPVCTVNDLKCLNKYKEKLYYLYPNSETKDGLEQEYQNSLFCPECLPDCEHTKHSIRSKKNSFESLDSKTFVYEQRGINFTNKCVVAVYQSTPDGILDRLDVTSYWFEIFSNFGGFAGLLLGLSITTVFEIVYFFILYTALKICCNKYQKSNERY